MDLEDVRRLFAYDQWANHRLVAAACELPLADFARDLGTSFGSVKGTLVHILDGEWVWLQKWQGRPRTRRPQPADFADAAALATAFPELEAEQREYLASLTDEGLRARLTYRERQFPLALLIQHLINHSTYHRGQVATLFRLLGRIPPSTDFGLFIHDPAADEGRPGAA